MSNPTVLSALDFIKAPREIKESEFKKVKTLSKHTFPSKMLERDIAENMKSISSPMLGKYYSLMVTKL